MASEWSERIARLSPEQLARLQQRLAQKSSVHPLERSIPHRGTQGPCSLSFAQERLWFFDQLEPQSPVYNICRAVHLVGPLDRSALLKALSEVLARHESLRTVFRNVQGTPVQEVTSGRVLSLNLIDLSDSQGTAQEEEVQRLLGLEARRPFDLSRDLMLRATLLRLHEEEHRLLIVMHHIASDGWSLGVLFRDLAALYDAFCKGESSPLPELAIQYADFAVWQRKWLQGEVLQTQLDYWKEKLSGSLPVLELPADRPRPGRQTYNGSTVSLVVTKELTEGLKTLSRREGVTLFVTLLAAFQVLLLRYTGQEDLLVGTPIANRSRAEIEGLIGFFVNTLVMRSDLSGNLSFRELLGRVQETALGAYAHQDLPFEKLVEELNPQRDLSQSLIFQVMFALQNMPMQPLDLPGLESRRMKADSGTSKFDLTFFTNEIPEGLSCLVEYNTDLFNADRIERMLGHFETLLQGIASNPEQRLHELPLLTHREREQLLVDWNNTAAEYPGKDLCLHQLIEAQAKRTPEAVAVEFEGSQLCYRELNERANRLAHYLRGMGVGPDTLVGVAMERSFEMVVALYGVLKAGGAYVPIDPEYPRERLAFMLQDANVALLLTQERLAKNLPDRVARVVCLDAGWPIISQQSDRNPVCLATPDNLAYMIYTSGSTGQPKGAMIPHRAIVNHMQWMLSAYPLTEADCVLQKTPFSFDAAVWEFYASLLSGGRLVVTRPRGHLDMSYMIETIVRHQVTILQLVPALLRMLLETPEFKNCRSLRRVFCGGEALPAELVNKLHETLDAELVNLYGPTEVTIDSVVYPVPRGEVREIVLIGRPVANTQAYILDRYLQPVPIGVTGQLYLGGVQVGHGYNNRAEMTAEKFIPDPFSHATGARLYKTGDLARYLVDGNIEFLGRADDQVKIRGFRIELGEVENTLRQHPAVHEAVVTAREDTPGDKRLVAYVVLAGEAAFTTAELRDYLKQKLPDYMVPAAYVRLEALPLTPNGKLDRKALPAPEGDAYAVRGYEAPQGEVETTLAGMWADLLKVEQVGRHDNFFELGGHSLSVVSLIERMRQKGLHADVLALFITPTLAELAAAVGRQGGLVEVPPNLIPLQCNAITPEMLPLVKLSATEIERIVSSVPGGAANVQDIYPLAPLQEGILYHHLTATHRDPYLFFSLYSMDSRARLDGYLGALQALIDRHDILRTAVMWEGLRDPVQVVWRKAPMPVEEVQLDPAGGDVAEQLRMRFDPRHYRINLSNAPLIHGCITHDAANERWLLLLFHHHLSSDHNTLDAMREEIQAHLLGQADRLPAPLPFRSLVAQARLGMRQEEHEEFFRRMLGDVDEPTAPFGLLDVQGDGSGIEEARLEVDAGLARRLRQRARKLGVSATSLCHLAWAQVLGRVSGREDVVFGTVLFGRMQGGEGANRVLGPFINTLPVRIRLGEEGVEASVRATHTQLADLLRHENASLALAQRCSAVPAPTPLFSALLNYRHSPSLVQAPSAEATKAREGIERLYAEERTNYPFLLSVDDLGEGFALTAQVPALTGPMRVCKFMHKALEGLVEALERAPATVAGSIDVLPESERRQVLEEWNDTKAEFPSEKCVHELFEEQAERAPGSVAVVFEKQHLSYGELNSRANKLADYLRGLGVAPGIPVGICAERSIEMMVGMLGILKAGGAYVPLEPGYPAERLSFMIRNAGVKVVLAQKRVASRLPSGLAQVVFLEGADELTPGASLAGPRAQPNPDSLAYVMYTSGSTGEPKGVETTHRSIVRLLFGVDYARFGSDEVFLQAAPISFDASTLEIWGALLHGAKLVLYPGVVPTPHELRELLLANSVTTLWLTSSLFNMVIDEAPDVLSSVRQLLVGGEALSPKHIQRALELLPNTQLINGYGPTETTTFATCYRIPKNMGQSVSPIPIGRPIANTTVYVLDRKLQPVPIGVPGELFIGGDGVARGYLKQPELTAQKFIPNPFRPGTTDRLYRTGDLVRYLPDGNLEFLGRMDEQVKIRGFRVEPGEIEAVLSDHHGVKVSAVTVQEDSFGEKRLNAYVVRHEDITITPNDLKTFLEQKLPNYMVPSEFHFLGALPLTPSGKIDRKSLSSSQSLHLKTDSSYVEPGTVLENQIVEIWEELLETRPIGIHHDFFELGGHSLLAVRMMSRIEEACGVRLPLAALFAGATIEHLARAVQNAEPEKANSPVVAVQPEGSKPPFFFFHGDWTGGGLYCQKLARSLGKEQPFFAIGPHGLAGERIPLTIEEMAADHLRTLLKIRPSGPYLIGGFCNGGLVAFEIARQMQKLGLKVDLLVVVDASAMNIRFRWLRRLVGFWGFVFRLQNDSQFIWFLRWRSLIVSMGDRSAQGKRAQLAFFLGRVKGYIKKVLSRAAKELPVEPAVTHGHYTDEHMLSVFREAIQGYVPGAYSGRLVLFRPSSKPLAPHSDPTFGWRSVARQVEVHALTGDHSAFWGGQVESFAKDLNDCLRTTWPPPAPADLASAGSA